MNPQPPVTRMRMAARTSSAEGGAPAEYSPAVAGLRAYIETWRARLAETGWTPWLILGLAAFLRFFLLGIKPPHFDECINGWFVDQVMHNGFYRYDPTNYHGPLHFYALQLSESLLDDVHPGTARALEIGEGKLPLVRRDGNGRHDSDQGNLRNSCRLRGDCHSRSDGFLCSKPRPRRQANETNVELHRSCNGPRYGRSRDRRFLFG